MFFAPYKVTIGAAALVVVLLLGGVLGWWLQGLRSAAAIAAKDSELAHLSGEIAQQNAALAAVEQAAKRALAQAAVAQEAAAKARKQAQAKAGAVMTAPASSCTEVLQNGWGKI